MPSPALPAPAQPCRPQGGPEPPQRCQAAPLPPGALRARGNLAVPSPREGNLFRASRRDRSLKASQPRGRPRLALPCSQRERVKRWAGLLVLRGPKKRGQSPRQPLGRARPSHRSRLLSRYITPVEMQLFNFVFFHFPFFSPRSPAFSLFPLPLWLRSQAQSCLHLPVPSICMAGSLPGLFFSPVSLANADLLCEDVTLAGLQPGEV